MKYVLIMQLPGCSKRDYDELIDLEEAVRSKIGELGIVDGHDIGSGERNIFVFTDHPEMAFSHIRSVFESKGVMNDLKAAHREIDGCNYTVLYPSGLKQFAVVGDE